jgi:hypothetical protein
METITGPELAAALEPYQPKTLDEAAWARFRDDAIALVAQLELSNTHQGIWHLSVLAHMLADVVPVRPHATLAELLCPEEVEGYLSRSRDAGMPPTSVAARRGGLNALLRAQAGERPRQQRQAREARGSAHARDQVAGAVSKALVSSDEGAVAFLRLVALVVTDHGVPGRNSQMAIRLEVRDGAAWVGHGEAARPWCAGRELPAAMSGTVTRQTVEQARRWVAERCSWRLEVRRLQLTLLTAQVGAMPAVEALALENSSLNRLAAAVGAARRPAPEVVTALLRGVQPPRGSA